MTSDLVTAYRLTGEEARRIAIRPQRAYRPWWPFTRPMQAAMWVEIENLAAWLKLSGVTRA